MIVGLDSLILIVILSSFIIILAKKKNCENFTD